MHNLPDIAYIVDGVYIGGARAAYHTHELRQAEITHVLKLYFFEPNWPVDFVVCNNPLNDGEFVPRQQMMRGVNFIRETRAADRQVLVVCGAGVSRSSTFVLAYLLECGYDLRDAWRLLRAHHPEACPAQQMWASLLAHYEPPYSMNDVVGWWFEDGIPVRGEKNTSARAGAC